MTRTVAREIAVMLCFREAMNPTGEMFDNFFEREYFSSLESEDDLFADFPDESELEYIRRLTEGVKEHHREFDDYIDRYSKGWKLGRISRIAVAIMCVAMYEVLYMDDIPDSAAINEAVEIAKGYEVAETVSFINGILGSFYRAEIEKSGVDDEI